jgi:hypothetical protein
MTVSNIGKEKLNGTSQSVLAAAPVEYSRQYQDLLNNQLRLYFTQIDNLTSSLLDVQATRFLSCPAGAFQDSTTQSATANTATVMTFNTTDFSNGVTVVTSGGKASQLTTEYAGLYNLQWSGQFQNTDNAQHDISVWLRVGGTDLAGSTGFISIPARKAAGAGNEGHGVYGWNYFLNLTAGQYVELWWSTTNAAVTLQYYAAGTSPTRPIAASVIATLSYVSRL